MIGWSGKLLSCEKTFLTNSRRALSPFYACGELAWYLARSNSIEFIAHYAPQYLQFAEPDGTANGAYGYRIAHNSSEGDALHLALKTISNSPESRQAVIAMWHPDDLKTAMLQKSKDLPCNVCWQFHLRDDVLHGCCYMRSNDVWLGMPYDIFVNTCILRMMADSLGARTGTYTHFVGSMHLYAKNYDAAFEALDQPLHLSPSHGWTDSSSLTISEIEIVEAEECLRKKQKAVHPAMVPSCVDNSLCSDVIQILADFNGHPIMWATVTSPLLRRGIETFLVNRKDK